MDHSGYSIADMAKPEPKDMAHHYSDVSKNRKPSSMKEYYRYFFIPGIAQLAGGLPNSQYFPFDTLEAQTAKPDRWTPTPNHPAGDGPLSSRLAATTVSQKSPDSTASHVVVPHDAPTSDLTKKIDLATALQYGQANGYLPLLSFIRQFTREVMHPNVPYKGGPEVLFTCGSTDGFSKCLELFNNHWIQGKNDIRERPGLLTEVFAYNSALNQAVPRGMNVVTVEMDDVGMKADGPGGLEDVLANWDDSKGKRPHMMYTVTMGHNPCGSVLTLERRKEIYALCSKFDVIIVEDDPYWYLQFPSAEVEQAKMRGQTVPERQPANTLEKKSGYEFLDSLVPSFLNIDIDGRVVRLDTFSKTIAPGCRMGYITSTPAICERFLRISEASTQQPSGFVQVVVAEMIMGAQPEALAKFKARPARDQQTFAGWKTDGWVRWLAGLRGEYERRMRRMCTILEENCYQLKQSTPVRGTDADWGVITKTQLYDFQWPRGGMFLWLHMRFETHPLWKATGTKGNVINGTVLSTTLMMFLTQKPHLVLIGPGLMFGSSDKVRAERGWAYYRLCFAAESDENVDAGAYRFAMGVQKFWRIKKAKELEDILDGEATSRQAGPDTEEGLANLGTWMGC
ncbi:aromatic amino acid aminotransferase [Xylariomycetidae sp. FL2044]|nr:aromatic amino acid aminotransferase [Xylariomycetidae sp. FL2044]